MKRKTRTKASGKDRSKGSGKKPIEQYEHKDKKRVNIPPVGLVTPQTDPLPPPQAARETYQHDPHLDPQLVWAGKAERTSFQVPTVSLHVHERIDPHTIIQAVKAKNGNAPPGGGQLPLFGRPEENRPLREEFPFYDHKKPLGWKNRLIAGDSLLVMNSLLEKEGLGGQVQMVYIDPPYGIRYGSNFQPFTNKRDVKDGSDDDLTLEPETLKAFRDTWELGIHSYLTYLRDRLLLAKELLHESGSCFVQISDENLHRVRVLMDEVFGEQNFCAIITFSKTSSATSEILPTTSDFIIWYAASKQHLKYRQLYVEKELGEAGATKYTTVMLPNGQSRPITDDELEKPERLPKGARVFTTGGLTSQRPPGDFPVEFGGSTYGPGTGYWKTGKEGFQKIILANRVVVSGNRLRYVRYFDDFAAFPITNAWMDIGGIQSRADPKVYVVQTATTAIQRCLLMTTDPGDLVFDPTCGSGTTAYVAEQWGWRAELLKTGIRAKGGAKIEFVRVEPLPGTRWLSADAEVMEAPTPALPRSTGGGGNRRAVVSFGPEHAPLEQRQVEMAIEEAQTIVPKPSLVIFASLQFDPEAAKDIDEIKWPGVTLLKAQMNGDLVTEDLKKKRSSNESFWLVGQPDIEVRRQKAEGRGQKKDKVDEQFVVEVHGFDYYNPKSGKVESGNKGNIAMWMLDPDYDGRSVYPRQVFFPMAGPKDGWARLAKNLRAEIDQELIEQYRGTVSLPFEKGKHGRAAVKIVDDRGIESLRIVGLA